ncbi:MAG: thiamine-phosphate kinase [Deltaproteobacteria bacterium]|nr:thiamine-phosphate kinase [Deltaproteobacteria bacterium]
MIKKEKLNETVLIKEIERLSIETQKFNKSLVIKSIGDDCAIIKDKNRMLVSSDSITENVHFNFDLYDFYEIGQKSLLVNLSDIAAMGGIPRLFLLSFFIPSYVNEDNIKQALLGIIAAAKKYRVSLIGGNISKSSEFSISATIIGDYKDKNVVKRFNSKKDNQVYISGELGNSWMAFYLNDNKNYIFKNYPNLKPEDKKLIENFINRYKLPKPRINLGRKLSEKKLANSLTDISDGLIKDIYNVIGHGCGCEINIDEIPINEELKYICKVLDIKDYIDKAVSFGEDYELLWTAEKYKEKELLKLSKTSTVKIKKIGHITDKPACVNFLRDGALYFPIDFTFKHL